MNWQGSLGKKIRQDVCLSAFTTFKIGGKARFYFEPRDARELSRAVCSAAKKKLKLLLLGAGSNLLISDRGVNALVMRLSSFYFTRLRIEGEIIRAAAGVKLSSLLLAASKRGLSGLEFSAGIPGTIGGALAMNAGAWGKDFAEIVVRVKVMDDNGKISTLEKKKIKFAYRRSSLNKYIILEATLKLKAADKQMVSRLIRDYLSRRRRSQENGLANAGCIFKNPAHGHSAGRVIDLCGFKGKVLGAAMVSRAHANFIVNKGAAACSDVLGLMRQIRQRVKARFGIVLRPEIKIWR